MATLLLVVLLLFGVTPAQKLGFNHDLLLNLSHLWSFFHLFALIIGLPFDSYCGPILMLPPGLVEITIADPASSFLSPSSPLPFSLNRPRHVVTVYQCHRHWELSELKFPVSTTIRAAYPTATTLKHVASQTIDPCLIYPIRHGHRLHRLRAPQLKQTGY
ncbi:hypothetical protein BU26DRAFT_350347 [Trematosphaeria pertusa]|uniref:Uncharacterized protein n=1 Tax=Trematosphaeria pertusa TaxID=390896 RepID=A0A6A6IB05_9PLEO|nr:uncharacterized protein BU26DRAFT_350347 [Trematosphaeria pertusa]KAF2247596.1 hypothetical protein BU26DRAFT_350347 [Trematosphaeria pertusa]